MRFQKAVKEKLKARVALEGPTGSGKTWTALEWATVLADGGPIAVIDTEHRSASYYADRFEFDTLHWPAPYQPNQLAKVIRDAGTDYAVLVVDSFTHFWNGEGGTLDMVDDYAQRNKGNQFGGWKTATPAFRHLIDTILAAPCHVIVTMRSKMEHVQEKRGDKTIIRKVGMAPEMRNGIEYEFTVVGELDTDHHLAITKSRCDLIADKVAQPHRADELAKTFRGWLDTGLPPTSQPTPPPEPTPTPEPEPRPPAAETPHNGHSEPSGGAERAAQRAYFAGLPKDLSEEDRKTLQLLATGDPTISSNGMNGRQKSKVTRWAHQIQGGELRLEQLLSGPALINVETGDPIVHYESVTEASGAS